MDATADAAVAGVTVAALDAPPSSFFAPQPARMVVRLSAATRPSFRKLFLFMVLLLVFRNERFTRISPVHRLLFHQNTIPPEKSPMKAILTFVRF
ncbi:hypothetical protein D3C75_1119570 [compost metagenome]